MLKDSFCSLTEFLAAEGVEQVAVVIGGGGAPQLSVRARVLRARVVRPPAECEGECARVAVGVAAVH